MVELGGCIIKLPIEWNDEPSEKRSFWEVLIDLLMALPELIEIFSLIFINLAGSIETLHLQGLMC